METALIYILVFLIIVGALIALETNNLLSSVISVGAVGFLLSLAFLALGAPEIAITQIVVEILCLIILLRATISRDLTAISGDREFVGMMVTVAIIFFISMMGLKAFQYFPSFGTPVMDRLAGTSSEAYLLHGYEKTGSRNIVTSIILDFRAYDTLGVLAVFFCGIMGVLAILRKKAHKDAEEKDDNHGAS